MLTVSSGYFELAIDQSPRPYRGVGIASQIVDFLVSDWITDGYQVSANGGVATSSAITALYAIGRDPIDHLDAVKGGAIVGGVDLYWARGCDVLENLSPVLDPDTAPVEEFAFNMMQQEMTDA